MNQNCVQSVRPMFLLLLLCFAGTLFVQAADEEGMRRKEINKSFKVGKSDLLKVDNRFGNITVTHWGKNEVEIRVVVESKTSSDERARREIDRVQIEISQSDRVISAETHLGEDNTNGQNGHGRRLTINYYVSMPSYLAVELAQKYGNINLPATNEGRCSLQAKYGNISAGNFTEELNIESKYGNVSLGNMKTARLDLGYCGNVNVGNAARLEIESKYSNVEMIQVEDLRMTQRYGNITCKSLLVAGIDMKYSKASIELVRKSLTLETMDYSDVKVNGVASSFEQISANARYGNLTLKIPSRSSFQVNAVGMKYGKCSIQDFKITHSSVEDKKDYRYQINGGKGGCVDFEGNQYSNLTIMEQ